MIYELHNNEAKSWRFQTIEGLANVLGADADITDEDLRGFIAELVLSGDAAIEDFVEVYWTAESILLDD